MIPIYPLPLRWGRVRVGVDLQIVFPLTSILSLRGERKYFVVLFSGSVKLNMALIHR
jgi:hypothetical protein